MNICRITRPPIKEISSGFPQREFHILSRLQGRGHNITHYMIQPAGIRDKYLSYGLGLLRSVLRFRRNDLDVIMADNIEAAVAALCIKFLYGIPFVFDFIDDYSLIAGYDSFKLRHVFIRFCERLLPRFADLVIVVDEHKRRFCARAGIPEERIVLIPVGTDTERFHPGITPVAEICRFVLDSHKVVLFVGKLNKYYRLESFIEAAPLVTKKFPDARFVVVGDGDNTEELKCLCGRLGMEEVIYFAGHRQYREMPGFIARADLCFFPLPDSSALALYEYMACGKPTVIPDYHTEKMGISGDLLPERCIVKAEDSPEGVAEKITELLKNTDLRDRVGREARHFVEQFHGWDALVQKFESAFVTAAAGKRRWKS
jgi:glycosyltransferase involved in cell wall biosynthesis